MNLNELRLKALLSLKRPLASPKNESTATETTENLFKETEEMNKEEGELSDCSSNHSEEFADHKEPAVFTKYTSHKPYTESSLYTTPYTEYKPLSKYSAHTEQRTNKKYSYNEPKSKKSKYTWTRPHQNHQKVYEDSSSYSNESLDTLKDLKSSLLCQLDENQGLLAASEDHEHELLIEIEDCRNLQKKCELERSKLEKKLEKLTRTICKLEVDEDESGRQVSCTNYKKYFVGKMLKESYCRSMGPKFLQSKLYKMYCNSIGIDPATFSFNHTKIDPQIPFCMTELANGKCPYRRETCTLQHIESLRYDNVAQVLKDYNRMTGDISSTDPYELIRKILEET